MKEVEGKKPFDIKAALQEIAGEWSTAVTDAELPALDEALTALRDLHDEQNGPPLETRREQWQAAMDRAIEVLQKHGA